MPGRKLISIAVLLIMLVSACADPKEDEQPVVNDSDTTASPNGMDRYPLTLTEAELHDDTVFTDGTRPTSWLNAGVTDSIRMKLFIRRLQRWVDQNQVDSISMHINYPVKNPGIPDAREFKLSYSTYFTDGVKGALEDQRLNQVFRNQQGVMIGQGQIWLREHNNNIQIFAINN